MAAGEQEDADENSRKTNMTNWDVDYEPDFGTDSMEGLSSMAGAVLPGHKDDEVGEAAGRILSNPESASVDDMEIVEEAWENMEKSPRAQARQEKEDALRDEMWEEFCAEDDDYDDDDWDDDDDY